MALPAQMPPRTGFKFTLVIKTGPGQGTTYQLLPPRVTIGRGPDNHVVVADPRVSRQAAVIEFTMEQITITDVSGRETLAVNGQITHSASIADGDMIYLGDSTFVFRVEALALAIATPAGFPAELGRAPGMAPPPRPSRGPSARGTTETSEGAKKVRFWIVSLSVIGGLAWYVNQEQAGGKAPTGLRTVEDIEKEIKATDTKTEQIEKERQFRSDEEKTRFFEANRHFQEGFRDYQKGQWQRSLRSFETARAIDPHHELAGRYYRLAERKRDEMVADLVLEGRRYKEKSMYARCSASFEKALDLIPNKQDVKYKSTEALKRQCDLLIEERFR